jgi:hypothetical protein
VTDALAAEDSDVRHKNLARSFLDARPAKGVGAVIIFDEHAARVEKWPLCLKIRSD